MSCWLKVVCCLCTSVDTQIDVVILERVLYCCTITSWNGLFELTSVGSVDQFLTF